MDAARNKARNHCRNQIKKVKAEARYFQIDKDIYAWLAKFSSDSCVPQGDKAAIETILTRLPARLQDTCPASFVMNLPGNQVSASDLPGKSSSLAGRQENLPETHGIDYSLH